jgi:Ca-activated chloride channel family protein
MKSERNLKLNICWDQDVFPAGKSVQRGLLVQVSGKETAEQGALERPPLNLALVIDRSGSMAHGRLAAAREAAIGISEQLRKTDSLSIVAFDDEVLVLLDAVKQNREGRAAARAAISELHSRGCTNLEAGWLMGARCAAAAMERKGLPNGHVILLSDGHANRGNTNPDDLARHASELAKRGVTSSCVGIGNGYSPLQLDAIAEAGRGQLHRSSEPGEIIDVTLGELHEMMHAAGREAKLVLEFPKGSGVRQLTRFRDNQANCGIELELGDIMAGSTRKAAFLVDVTAGFQPGEALPFKARLTWRAGKDNTILYNRSKQFMLTAVKPDDYRVEDGNGTVIQTIADLWVARMGYEAMLLNERGHYDRAVKAFTINDAFLEQLLGGLDENTRHKVLAAKRRAQVAVSAEWHGPSKLAAMTLSKKMMRSERDHTGRSTKGWADNVPDK